MNMNYGLHQVQTQKLSMTPQLTQAIKMLQYSSLELQEYLKDQMDENPLIDLQESDHASYTYSTQFQSSEDQTMEHFFDAGPQTLEQHLQEQMKLLALSDQQKQLVIYLIGSLDESGYLTLPLEEAAAHFEVTQEEVEQALNHLQALDPPGVGARDVQECLLLQVKQATDADPLTPQVIQQYIEQVATGNEQKVAQELGISRKRVATIFAYIRDLEPKPGSCFQEQETRYIVPDVVVEEVEGEYVVMVNEQTTPRLAVNDYYKNMIRHKSQASLGDETKKYIQDKWNAAMWLVRSLEQRRATLHRVTEAIVNKQRAFFDQGIVALQPMTLHDIATMVDVHESTVSRATNNKYVQTPRGLFELKYFFTSALGKEDGGTTSSESVKVKIKHLINKEDRKKPLSDQRLSDTLKQEGIKVSRRTVAKYREQLRIPSSSKRKRLG